MTGPLNGLKVLDFSTLLPGPYATMMFADMGAEVTRVVAPGRTGVRPPGAGGKANFLDQTLARSKRCIAVNMKEPTSKEIIERLVKSHDILVEQFRPGVMARLGWSYDDARKVNPNIIYAALTGYGQDGPMRDRAGHDLNYLALSGIVSYTGRKAEGPVPYGTQVADIAAGSLMLVIGILAAVYHREKTGEGQFVDVAMLDGSIALNAIAGSDFLTNGRVPQREAEMLNGGCLYDCYRTSDGEYLSVGGLEPKFLADFLAALELSELAPPNAPMMMMPNIPEAKKKVAERIASKTLAEWIEIFARHDACVEPVLDLKDMTEHRQTKAREMVVEVDDGAGGTARQFAHPIKFSVTKPEYRFIGRAPGADNDAVLAELGFSADEIASFAEKGAIGS